MIKLTQEIKEELLLRLEEIKFDLLNDNLPMARAKLWDIDDYLESKRQPDEKVYTQE